MFKSMIIYRIAESEQGQQYVRAHALLATCQLTKLTDHIRCSEGFRHDHF